jgi:small subunit ribosomal protein S17
MDAVEKETPEQEQKKTGKKMFTGIVVSDKMEKSIVIQVSTKQLHPLYKKYVAMSKKFMAHDEENDAHIGDTVRIIETRPMSKRKTWKLVEIVERAK